MAERMGIFIDTSLYISFYNEKDQNHGKAKAVMSDVLEGKYGEQITSDYVFDEAVTVMLARTKNLEHAINTGENIRKSAAIVMISTAILNEAWEIFKNHNQQKMSFTDCTSRVFVENLGIKNIATFDSAFKKIKGINVIDSASD